MLPVDRRMLQYSHLIQLCLCHYFHENSSQFVRIDIHSTIIVEFLREQASILMKHESRVFDMIMLVRSAFHHEWTEYASLILSLGDAAAH